jgi:hypothetical protein
MKAQRDDTALPSWPSGYRKLILELGFTSIELRKLLGDTFERTQDDLDWCERGFIIDSELGLVVFVKYDNLPSGGTLVFVDSEIKDISQAINRLLSVLQASESEVNWRAPQ